jgi:transposase-like protein
MRFTLCGCDTAYYQRLPKKWWMRAFPTRHRYRCKSCGARMLVGDGSNRARVHWLVLLAVCLVVLGVVVWAVGYWEAASEAAWKRSVSE